MVGIHTDHRDILWEMRTNSVDIPLGLRADQVDIPWGTRAYQVDTQWDMLTHPLYSFFTDGTECPTFSVRLDS